MKLSDTKLGEAMTPQDRHAELTREIVAARNAGDFDKAEALNEQRRCAEIDIDEQCIEGRSERPAVGGRTMKLSDVKLGEMFMLLKGSSAVYIRGEYDRATKRYSVTRFDDINAERFMKGSTPITTDFEF